MTKKHKHKKVNIETREVGATKQVNISTPAAESLEVKSINLMKYKVWYLALSALIIIPGLISLGLFGLKTTIDFTGGSVLKFSRIETTWNKAEIEQISQNQDVSVVHVAFEDRGKTVSVRTKPIDAAKNEKIKSAVNSLSNDITQISFETVGPSIGEETVRKSTLAFVAACVGIVLYIAYAFRNIPKPYSSLRFGLSAILAMIHDAFVVLGVFSILGHFEGVEIDPMFITALLTIIGFSVHDTIVVFDRVRENLRKYKNKDIEWVANYSLLETMRRSIATSATVVITLTSLFIFGGSSVKWFVLALLVGVVSGTYSSIFNATPVLVIWENFLNRRTKK